MCPRLVQMLILPCGGSNKYIKVGRYGSRTESISLEKMGHPIDGFTFLQKQI